MKNKNGIGLITLIVIIAVVLVVGAVTVTLFITGNQNSDEVKDNNSQVESAKGIQEFVEDVKQEGNENSKVIVNGYKIPSQTSFTWENINEGVRITGYTGDITAVEVPSTIDGKNVIEIGNKAFSKKSIVGIKLPDTIKTIADSAFYYCTQLVEVTFGDSTEIIGDKSFEGCIALTKITFNNGLIKIGNLCFGFCTSLKAVNLPKTLETIDEGAFCLSGLETITIPSGVKIGRQAFSTCSSLANVNIENGVQIIEAKAFEACSNLTKVNIPSSVNEIGLRAFSQSNNVTIYASTGSYAITYAKNNNINFVEL